jgi:hypothetical protein
MSDLQKLELAIRRAASQMPNGQSRAFRLVAAELESMEQNAVSLSIELLNTYRYQQRNSVDI